MSILRFARILAQTFLPSRAARALMSLYGILVSPVLSFSQKGEDLLVRSYFNRIGIKNGVYCDIGCFHPIWISNTHLLHKAGWKGFCVDIDEFKLSSMKFWRRKNVECILGAVCGNCDPDDLATVYKFKNRIWSDIDTLDKATAEEKRKGGSGDFVESNVNLLDINWLFSSFPHINFLNIDIEGVDKDVILALDLKKYRPELILFEDNKNWGGCDSIRNKLEHEGYERLFVTGGSICYALAPNLHMPT